MHRLKRMGLWIVLVGAAAGFHPALDAGSRSLRAAGAEFLYLNLWGMEACWSDCARGAYCCKLVYLVEE